MSHRPDMRKFEASYAEAGGFDDADSQLEVYFSRRCDELRMAIFDAMTKVVPIDLKLPTWAYYDLAPKFANPEDHDNVARNMVVMTYPHHTASDKVVAVRIIANEIIQGDKASWLISEDFIIDSYGNTQYAPKTASLTPQSVSENQVPIMFFSSEGVLLIGGLSALPNPAVVGDESSDFPNVFPYGDFTCIESSIESLDHGQELLNELATAHLVKTS